MTARRVSKILALALACAMAMLIIAPSTASAEDVFYPGPLGDEVLSAEVTADTADPEPTTDEFGTFSDGTNLSFVRPNPEASGPIPAGSTGGTGGGLAATGSTVEPIIAVSIGFMAIGASAVVSSRRRVRDIFS